MTHTPENSPQSTLGRALGLGAVAGVRSMSAPALLSRAASRGNIEGIEDTPFAFLASSRAARILTVLAVGEALADKLPFSPDRISPPGLIGRMASGGLVGAALFAAAGHRATIGAGLGLLSAAAASYPSYYLRVKTQEKFGVPNWALGLVEDVLAEGGGLLALRGRG
ncbi:MAG TPA: DUF4126 family protein [Rubrobacteraceae bacterium]|jgi:uncharacterized membrane protein|nr:DUF4126 family protein [Rubrobacteraceae bacterium]